MMLYEIMCLAMAIYHEARGEPIAGQYAVAQVVMNRVHDPRYPSDACSVVYEGGETRHECQFSFFCDGKSDQPTDYVPWHVAQLIAKAVYEGKAAPVVGGATHYHARRVHPDWASSGYVVATVNDHIFYRGVK
jgi:spore germination cell wall hydrolase CwlJ-like protein